MLKGVDPRIGVTGAICTEGELSLTELAGLEYSFQGFIDMARLGISPALMARVRAQWIIGVDLPDLRIGADTPPRYNDFFSRWHQAQAGRLREIGLLSH